VVEEGGGDGANGGGGGWVKVGEGGRMVPPNPKIWCTEGWKRGGATKYEERTLCVAQKREDRLLRTW
jgi:hypothetical protein